MKKIFKVTDRLPLWTISGILLFMTAFISKNWVIFIVSANLFFLGRNDYKLIMGLINRRAE